MDNQKRATQWQRNPKLEAWLTQMAQVLGPAEAEAQRLAQVPGQEWPQVFVLGAPRSGTTLLMQWLAASGAFAYPTNLMARFYTAPTIGARLQQLLTDPELNFREELADLQPAAVGFESNLGKTQGALAPNEFWYLWRRFLPVEEIEPLGERAAQVDAAGLRQALGSIAAVFAKPFASKGMMMQYDLGYFAEALPRAVFLHVQRDGVSNAESLLRARQNFFGNTQDWYSAKPPEYERLAARSPEEQVVGQVYYTQRAIEDAFRALPPERVLTVPYAAFCAQPEAVHRQLWERLAPWMPGTEPRDRGAVDSAPIPPYTGPAAFRCTDPSSAAQASDPQLAALSQAWQALG